MNLQEFTARIDELDGHIAAVLQMFKDDTGVKVGSLLVTINEDGDYEMTTGLEFPASKDA
jgi:hypothetical protein